MTHIDAVRQSIGKVIDDFGGDSERQRMDPNSWLFRKGSATGFVMVHEDPAEPGNGDLLIVCEIMRVPADRERDFYRRLLELNDALCGKAAFCVNQDDVVLLQSGRKLEGIGPEEISDQMLRTAALADRYDDVLLGEFGHEHALDLKVE
ncbi:MAG TPA: YbjN domain-containing protein [Longimicrobiales bacterium]|nr:YbjN domain-containing protein [Longimicrobiales bacterium]